MGKTQGFWRNALGELCLGRVSGFPWPKKPLDFGETHLASNSVEWVKKEKHGWVPKSEAKNLLFVLCKPVERPSKRARVFDRGLLDTSRTSAAHHSELRTTWVLHIWFVLSREWPRLLGMILGFPQGKPPRVLGRGHSP